MKNTNIKNIKNIELYIKLDYDTIEDSPVIVISFHSRRVHPIKNNLVSSKDTEDAYKILEKVGVKEESLENVYKKLISPNRFYDLLNRGKIKASDNNIIIKYDLYSSDDLFKKNK